MNVDGEVLPFDYDDIRPLMGTGNMLMKEGKTWALVNKEGKEISKDTYDDVSYALSGKYPSRMFVRSNYFDAEGNAALVANEITVDSFSPLSRRAKTESTCATSMIGFPDCRHTV